MPQVGDKLHNLCMKETTIYGETTKGSVVNISQFQESAELLNNQEVQRIPSGMNKHNNSWKALNLKLFVTCIV